LACLKASGPRKLSTSPFSVTQSITLKAFAGRTVNGTFVSSDFLPTRDRGLQMAKNETFTAARTVNVYCCDPHSLCLRGTKENTNRLPRGCFPKRTDPSGYAQSGLDKVTLRPNQRPRKTLGFHSAARKLRARVAPTR
jgi:IS30 family transposase